MPWGPFVEQHIYDRRRDIHAVFGGQQWSGISTPSKHPVVFLFTSPRGRSHGYADGWTRKGTYRYFGEWQDNDEVLKGGNRAVRDHIKDGKALLLFEAYSPGQVRFLGQFRCNGISIETAPDHNDNQRRAIVFILRPTTPKAEPGPTFEVQDGQLQLSPSRPEGSFDEKTQEILHAHIRKRALMLRGEILKSSNSYPGLVSVVNEYADLIDRPFANLSIVDLWAVGNGLMAQAAAFERQDPNKSLKDPLDASQLSLLLDIRGLHGGFILGFPKGRELTDHADHARLSPDEITAVEAPTATLLEVLATDHKVVSLQTRRFLEAIRSSLITGNWEVARIGYTACVTTRNAIIALGRASAKFIALAGGLSGVGLLAGDPNLEQARLLLSFLQINGSLVLSFAASFPELHSWVVWILGHLHEDQLSSP